jgi:radical SAM superfamily enzyme YgiQ (UPF0313 family)
MKFLILSENSNGAWPYLHYRGLGAFELKKRIKKHGHDADILDWFTHWKNSDLTEIINRYFKGTDQPVIAVSTPFNNLDLYKIESVLRQAKQNFPSLKIIHGGSRTFQESLGNFIDVFFLGRSMEMFDAWVRKDDLSKYIIRQNPMVLLNNDFDQKIDNPVIPVLDDNDCYTERDILGFEIGVGCKFNCTFCNYELRGSKITKFLDPKELHEYFDKAYNKYGITNFYSSDDTINESERKLEIIVEAMEGLNYKPKITSFARLDLINKRKQQLDFFERIQFRALFFGIESFNPEVSKTMRKRTGLIDNYETLREIKQLCPDTYTIGSLIVGLKGDSKESIVDSIEKVIREKLLWGIQVYPLVITKSSTLTDNYFLSDLDQEPEKYGFKTKIPITELHGDRETVVVDWEGEWIDHVGAINFADELYQNYKEKILWLNHYEYAGFKALGLIKPEKPVIYEQLKNQAFSVSGQLKQNYITKKKSIFGL